MKRNVFISINFLVIFCEASHIFLDVANFCQNNGMKYVTLTSDNKEKWKKETSILVKKGIRVKSTEIDNLYQELNFDQDVLLMSVKRNVLFDNVKIKRYLGEISKHKVRRSVFVFNENLRTNDELLLEEKLESLLDVDAFFYLMYSKEDTIYQKKVISLRNSTKTLVQDLKFNDLMQIEDEYNLEGITLISNTLSWAPYFLISGCDEFGQNCTLGGFLSDYMDAMGRIMNFTWTSHAPPDGNWGVRPLSGPFNKSGVWGGAMGGVVNGDYHISLSQWVWNIERYGLLDFISTSTNRICLALTPQPPEVDPGLFIRPFTDEAWGGIGIMFVIILFILFLPYIFIRYYEDTNGYNMMAFTSWMFFVLINAFYGGALTMFFTSELTIPFNSIEDVMRAYPSWKLKMMTGNDVHFQYKAVQGDPLYSEFWNRVINKPEETVYSNLQEGLDLLLSERAILHTMTGMLKGFFQANPFRQQNLKVFAYGRAQYYALIVPFNSPLKPILQMASMKLTEAGTNDHLITAWEGKAIPQIGAVEAMVLSAGQVILVFFIVCAMFSVSFICFFGELVHKNYFDTQNKSDTIDKIDTEGK